MIRHKLRLRVADSVRGNLAEATLFPRRFGRPSEFAHMAISIIENQMLNASGQSTFACREDCEYRRLEADLGNLVIRLDGGSRVPKL